jgi:hypothetical protein
VCTRLCTILCIDSIRLQIEDTLTFDHPIDCRFAIGSLVSWPSLMVSLWIGDDLDRQEIGALKAILVGAYRYNSPTV